MQNITLSGVVAVLVTPFDVEENIVHDDITRQVEAAISFGISAVCLPAYAGEFYKLSESERLAVVQTAVQASKNRISVIGQSNHPSAHQAAKLAKQNADIGADLISFAIPRQFGLTENDILSYCQTICDAVRVPILIQDFNPGGATIGASFCKQLRDRCPNFAYVKLEEPLLGPKLRAICDATENQIGVLEGWGGMYVPELLDAGITGVMPGLGHADLMQHMWNLGTSGQMDKALDVFDDLLAQVVYSLQNLELYLKVEKHLLAERGIIQNTTVRSPSLTVDKHTFNHAIRLNQRILKAISKHGLTPHPNA